MNAHAQAAPAVLMIRPKHFGFNSQTASSNAFQQDDGQNKQITQKLALQEFDDFVHKLRQAKINVIVMEDTDEPAKPDAVFPNNWVSFHSDGSVLLYPMYSESRRHERSVDILLALQEQYHFDIKRVINLSKFEDEGHYLEGTGSMVFDYEHKVLYANYSPRTAKSLLDRVSEQFGLELIVFHAFDNQNLPIYHTNVIMSVGSGYCVLCEEVIRNQSELQQVKQKLVSTGHEIISITFKQARQFVGNVFEVSSQDGNLYLAMSQTAFDAYTTTQIRQIKQYASPLFGHIPTIEQYGGGSARCMMAGLYLPKMD